MTLEEENLILSRVQVLCNYGFPATTDDVCHYIQTYLNTKNRTVPEFKNNYPGPDFMFYFMKRHADFTKRLVSNIKRAQAAVDRETLQGYIEHLEKELEGVPPSNIWNYDETCLVNDPGRVKCIVKRGTGYPERVINHTKAGVSIMFCGNAEGEGLPPSCVYKSTAVIMNTWIRGAPEGTKFNRSVSGWFDEGIFECFFNDMLLPRMKNQDGTKVMIGDNLLSHISELVIRSCQKHNIRFICLPSNSTHMTQPLDVAYFKPLKVAWRKILNEFCKTKMGQKETSIPKDIFPQLLTKLVKALDECNGKEKLVSGFRKCGIVPCDVTPLLGSLPSAPSSSEDNVAAMDEFLIKILTELRKDGPKRTYKSKKVTVVAGKSASAEVIAQEEEATTTKASTSKKVSNKDKQKSKRKDKKKASSSKKRKRFEILDSESEDEDLLFASSSHVDNDEDKVNQESQRVSDEDETEAAIRIGCYVKIIHGMYKGFYATVVDASIEEKFGKWILKKNDLDSREENDLMVVKGKPDNRGRFTFQDTK